MEEARFSEWFRNWQSSRWWNTAIWLWLIYSSPVSVSFPCFWLSYSLLQRLWVPYGHARITTGQNNGREMGEEREKGKNRDDCFLYPLLWNCQPASCHRLTFCISISNFPSRWFLTCKAYMTWGHFKFMIYSMPLNFDGNYDDADFSFLFLGLLPYQEQR